jgi:LPS export ABC transporter permease LptF/LPS export ABC transporter permease LptG
MNLVHRDASRKQSAGAVLEWRQLMRIIDRYICREVLSHSLLGLTVFTFVFFVPQLVQLMDLVVRHSGSAGEIAELFLCTFPGVLTFTVPIAVLSGVLIGLGRMSADSELIAMNAVGVGLRRLLAPIGAIALFGLALTASMTIWLVPLSVRTFRVLEERLRTSQASFQIQPRVFDEQFPHLVLYVQDVSAAATHWHGVFLAESDAGDISRLTLAEDAIVIADSANGKLELHLREGGVHEFSLKNADEYSLSAFGERDFSLALSSLGGQQTPETTDAERSLGALLAEQGTRKSGAHVEFHRRLAFPAACLVFALLALPLGARPRRGGRAGGFLMAVIIVCAYYVLLAIGAGMARDGTAPPWLGIWGANIVIGLAGLALLPGIERMQEESRLARVFSVPVYWIRRHMGWMRRTQSKADAATNTRSTNQGQNGDGTGGRLRRVPGVRPRARSGGGFPQFLDFYLLGNFSAYFLVLLAGFLVLFEVFTFLDLLDDIAQHRTSVMVIVDYFLFFSCYLFYQLAPLGCLVAVLVTLGVMTKNNELVAFKAAGVSLYRIALPLLGAGILFAAGLFVLDATYLPYANQRQDALRNAIKGRPAQTYYQPQRQWIFGDHSKVYNYQFFDPDKQLFGGLSVFELDPATFAVKRRIYAERAHWEPQQSAWILESGWTRDFANGKVAHYEPFLATELAELDEPPNYFSREVRQSYQMNWWQLRRYIAALGQAGFDVAQLSVQLQKKLAFPLIAPVIILLAIPFSILVGTRGAVGGLVLGLSLSISYWAAAALFEAMGSVGQLPAVMAAWAPDAVFLFLGLYFFLKMPT